MLTLYRGELVTTMANVAPDALATLEQGTLAAVDRRNQGNPTPIPPLGPGGPGLVHAPFACQGATRAFPNVQPGR